MKYHIITYGCQMNKSDSEKIAAILVKKGYKPAKKMSGADLIVVNMCSVRQSAVDRIYGLAQKFKGLKTKKVLTGCVLKKDEIKFRKIFDAIWDNETRSHHKAGSRSPSKFIPISSGCNNFCTYCVVPYTRGRLICRDHKEILREIKGAAESGVKEIWLLGQNVNDYQSPADKNINLAKLLKAADCIPGDFKIRFTSPHPADFTDELMDAMAGCKKTAKFLNLPVQSGDNKILKRMNRPYTVEEYKNLVKKIRKAMPNINLSTDVIVGFPGETKKQFENTVKLFKEMKFNIAYIAKYSPRPGTAAFQLKNDVPLKEKKQREKILMNILEKQKRSGSKKIIVILGQTASGKSELAIKLAKKFDGEVISADSRQVYRGMDIGTGKMTEKEMRSIPHHLLDVASPKRRFTVAQYRKLALDAMNKIFKKGKIPILCGGNGFYIQAVVDGLVIPQVAPDWKLRKKLEKKSIPELYGLLKRLDPGRAKTIEKENPRRLIRAVEIVLKTKKPVPALKTSPLPYPVLMLGLKLSKKELKGKIEKRVKKMLKLGLKKEAKKFPSSRTIGYQEWSFPNAENLIVQHTIQYAKRQMTWFKRDKRIHWVRHYKEAEKLVKSSLL